MGRQPWFGNSLGTMGGWLTCFMIFLLRSFWLTSVSCHFPLSLVLGSPHPTLMFPLVLAEKDELQRGALWGQGVSRPAASEQHCCWEQLRVQMAWAVRLPCTRGCQRRWWIMQLTPGNGLRQSCQNTRLKVFKSELAEHRVLNFICSLIQTAYSCFFSSFLTVGSTLSLSPFSLALSLLREVLNGRYTQAYSHFPEWEKVHIPHSLHSLEQTW